MGYFESLSESSVFTAEVPGILAPGRTSLLGDGGTIMMAPDAETPVGMTIYITDPDEAE